MSEKAGNKIARMGRAAKKASEKMDMLGGAIGSAAIVGGMAMAVKQSMAIEDALQDLVRVGGLTGTELNKMDRAMENLSETLGTSKVGLLQQAFEGLKMGIPTEEVETFVKLAARTAISFDMIDREAGRALGSLKAKLGLSINDLGELMDSVNLTADSFATDGARMINIIERTSGTMGTLKMPTDVIAGLAGFADMVETSSELAASGLNQIFAKMKQNPRLVKQLMLDPVATLTKQFKKFADIDPSRRFKAIESKFGLEAARFMEKAVGKLDDFTKIMKTAASDKAMGSMLRELENRAGRSSTIFKILGAVATNTFEDLGNSIKPMAVALARFAIAAGKTIKGFVERNPEIVKFGAILASIVAIAGIAGAALFAFSVAAGLISGPILAIAAGVFLAGAAVTRWVDSNNPLIASLTNIWNGITNALAPLGQLFGITGEGVTFLESMATALDLIGVAIAIILTPVELLARSLQGLVEVGAALVNLDFGAAMDALSSLYSDAGNVITGKIDTISTFVGGNDVSDDVAARKQADQNLNITGNIDVSAQDGSKVESATFAADTGSNTSWW